MNLVKSIRDNWGIALSLVVLVAVVAFGFVGSQAAEQCAGYPDVDLEASTCSAIEFVKKIDVMTGQDDGTFGYGATLNRAEAAAVLVRYLDLPETNSRTLVRGFEDMQTDNWYTAYFEVLIARNIYQGYDDGTMRPEGTLNRAEWLTLWYRTLAMAGSTDEVNVADVPVNDGTSWYRFFLNDAIDEGYVDLDNGSFRPADGQTRELVAELIYRVADAQEPVVAISTKTLSDDPYLTKFVVKSNLADLPDLAAIPFSLWLSPQPIHDWASDQDSVFADLDDDFALAFESGLAPIGYLEYSGGDANDFVAYFRDVLERYVIDYDSNGFAVPVLYWFVEGMDKDLAERTYEVLAASSGNALLILDDLPPSIVNEDQIVALAVNSSAITNLDTDLIWLADLESDSATKMFTDFVEVAEFAQVDKVVVSVVDSNFGQRKGDEYSSLMTLVSYLDRYTSVERESDNHYVLEVLDWDLQLFLAGEIPEEYQTGTVGVTASGVVLLDSDFGRNFAEPVIVWRQ